MAVCGLYFHVLRLNFRYVFLSARLVGQCGFGNRTVEDHSWSAPRTRLKGNLSRKSLLLACVSLRQGYIFDGATLTQVSILPGIQMAGY